MNGAYVADAGAMIAYLRNEPGGEVFAAVAEDPNNTVYAHGTNLAEVFYDARRRGGAASAQQAMRILGEAGILFRRDFGRSFWEDAARIKADYRRVSLADCFGLALAGRLDATFLTTDHHELDALAGTGLCRIQFTR